MALFLTVLRAAGNVTRACRAARVTRPTVGRWLDEEPGFKELVEDAFEEATDGLEEEARRRAMKKSDALLMFLLRGYRKQKFGEASGVINQVFAGQQRTVVDVTKLTDDELEALTKIGQKLGIQGPPAAPGLPAPGEAAK